MRIGLISVFVDDQDEAQRFYTAVLGLRVKDDAAYTDTERWLTVVSLKNPTVWSSRCSSPTNLRERSDKQTTTSAAPPYPYAPKTADATPNGSKPSAWYS